MKRHGFLFERVVSFEALSAAALKAMRGKKAKPRSARFFLDLEGEVFRLLDELESRTYQPRPYRTFVVREPKERRICAADFRDRVVHHAACEVLEPIFERSFIRDSYACRKGRGPHAAIRRARECARQFSFFLKLDVRKFFDSVDHKVLKGLLRCRIKDRDFLWLLDRFIDHPVPWAAPGKGIPIGNLTSQHFANFYLDPLDHLIKDELGVRGYLRYMDDLVMFGDDKARLWAGHRRIATFLNERLKLEIKPGSVVLAPVTEGLPFLGMRVFPGVIRLQRAGWSRFARKLVTGERLFLENEIDLDSLTRRAASLVGHVVHADTRLLRRRFFDKVEALQV